MLKNLKLEALLKDTVKSLGLSSSFLATNKDVISTISMLSSLDEKTVTKVFKGFLLYFVMNYIETPHKRCTVPFIGQLSTLVYAKKGSVLHRPDGTIAEEMDELASETTLHLLERVKDDIKAIYSKKDKKLNMFEDLVDDCSNKMQKASGGHGS